MPTINIYGRNAIVLCVFVGYPVFKGAHIPRKEYWCSNISPLALQTTCTSGSSRGTELGRPGDAQHNSRGEGVHVDTTRFTPLPCANLQMNFHKRHLQVPELLVRRGNISGSRFASLVRNMNGSELMRFRAATFLFAWGGPESHARCGGFTNPCGYAHDWESGKGRLKPPSPLSE